MSRPRPDIFIYHDYRRYLQDVLEWLKSADANFSLRKFAESHDLSQSWMSMVFSGQRKMTLNGLSKLASALKLAANEKTYLEQLWTLNEAGTNAERLKALNRLQKFSAYQDKEHSEAETHAYLNKWYYVAIREMASLKTFKADAKWIQNKLRIKLSLKEINQALDFLFKHQYLVKTPTGKVVAKDRQIDCYGGVYKVSLANFHRQMFNLVESSMTDVERERREILGHTFAISESQLEQLKAIMNKALGQIISEEQVSNSKDAIYHITMAAIPLTEKP